MFVMKTVIYKGIPIVIFMPSPVNDNLSEGEDIDSQETRDFLQVMFPEWCPMIYQTAENQANTSIKMSDDDIRNIIKGYGG